MRTPRGLTKEVTTKENQSPTQKNQKRRCKTSPEKLEAPSRKPFKEAKKNEEKKA